MKKLKKLLAMLLVFAFAATLVPTVGMAQEVSATIQVYDIVNVAGGGRANTKKVEAFGGSTTIKVQCGSAGNNWRAFGKFDLSGYEEILENENTVVNFKMTVGGHSSTLTQTDVIVYLMNDNFDNYDADNITWNTASELGFFDLENNAVEIANVAKEGTYSKGQSYTSGNLASVFSSALKKNKGNSIVTLGFYTNSEDGDEFAYFNKTTAQLSIKYEDSLVNNADHAEAVADSITWEQLSAEAQNSVTQNLTLPSKLYGADIVWSSSDSVISSDGTVTQTYVKQPTTLTATVTYKDAVATTSFDVIVNNKTYAYTGVSTGESSFYTVNSSSTSKISIDTQVAGNYGKDASNVIYNVHDISATDGTMLNYMVSNSDPALNNDVMEFSICLPSGSPDVVITAGVLNATGNTGAGSQTDKTFTMTTNGFYFGSQKIYETKANQWYTMAFVAPKGMKTVGSATSEDDKTGEVYVNGELVNVMTFNTPTSYGFRYFRFIGNDVSLNDTGYYLDNVRWHCGEYISEYDALAVINSEYMSKSNNTITLKEATVASVKSAIEKADDTIIRIYDSNGNIVADENAAIQTGYTLVAAAKNGTDMERSYAYYNIKVTGEGCAFDIPAINIENNIAKSEIKLYNNSNSDAQYTAYLAIYSGGELLKVITVPVSANSGKISVTPIEAPISQGNTAKLMVWDGTTPQFATVEK